MFIEEIKFMGIKTIRLLMLWLVVNKCGKIWWRVMNFLMDDRLELIWLFTIITRELTTDIELFCLWIF
jgi:general stress protein 26